MPSAAGLQAGALKILRDCRVSARVFEVETNLEPSMRLRKELGEVGFEIKLLENKDSGRRLFPTEDEL